GLVAVPANLEVVTAIPDADLSIAAAESADPVQAGTPLDYTVDVANAGPAVADGTEVEVILDASLLYEGYSGTDWTCAEASGTVNCSYAASVAATGSASPLTIQTTPLSAGMATTSFTVSSGSVEDGNAANDEVSVETTVTPAPNVDMTLNASVSPGSVNQGSDVTLTLISANVGSDAASNVSIT